MPSLMGDPLYQADFNAHESITVADSSIGLTASTYGQSRAAFLTLETAQIRWTVDGTTPTTTVGHVANPNDTLTLKSSNQIARFRAIRTGGTSGTLKVSYAR